MLAYRAAELREFFLQRVEDTALRDGAAVADVNFNLARRVGEVLQMLREDDSDHCSVCTSTDNTAGKSLTIGFHESPLFGEQYTCPPVVPK